MEALEERGLMSVGYSITNLGTLGGNDGGPTGLNDRGQEVGWSYTRGDEVEYGFVASGGKLESLGSLLHGDSYATGINDRGEIVGYMSTKDGSTNRAFLDADGKIKLIGPAISSYDFQINNRGQVVGFSTTSGDAELWSKGKLEDLGSLKGEGSVALGINDRGTVVGYSEITPVKFISPPVEPCTGCVYPAPIGIIPATEHAFVYRDGQMTDLGTLGGPSSEALAINKSGTIVGWADTDGDIAQHAFVYRDGRMTDLGTLGGSNSGATAINDKGQVVGWSDINGYADVANFLYSDGKMVNLQSLLPSNSGITIGGVVSINDRGQIAAYGRHARRCPGFAPVDSDPRARMTCRRQLRRAPPPAAVSGGGAGEADGIPSDRTSFRGSGSGSGAGGGRSGFPTDVQLDLLAGAEDRDDLLRTAGPEGVGHFRPVGDFGPVDFEDGVALLDTALLGCAVVDHLGNRQLLELDAERPAVGHRAARARSFSRESRWSRLAIPKAPRAITSDECF